MASSPENRSEAGAPRLAFAGLELELTGDADACARVARVARAVLAPGVISPEPANTPAPKFAARCRLQMVPRHFWFAGSPTHEPAIERELPPSGLAWNWTARGGELVTQLGGARLSPASGFGEGDAAELSGFEGEAWLERDARAPHHLLGGLALLLMHRLGGCVLHAASVELDGAVVAFVGPSGAGKSTASRHVEGAPLVSVDRLAVLPRTRSPRETRWFSHPLPGGTRPVPDLANSPLGWRPLAAVLRVHQSTSGTALVAAAPARAVTLLRESTFQSGLEPSAERELLGALDDLVQHVPVGRLELQLGASLKPLLRRWLKSQAEERR